MRESLIKTVFLAMMTVGVIVLDAFSADDKAFGTRPAQSIDRDAEDVYWRQRFITQPDYDSMKDYNHYQPAYRYGMDVFDRYGDQPYEELNESELRKGWEKARANSTLTWDEAKRAVRDAYNRLYQNRRPSTAESGSNG